MRIIEGHYKAPKGQIAIVAASFNALVVDPLLSGALETFKRHGVKESQLTVVRVPGAFEIPLVCERLAASGRYQAILALGCVIRGATAHFDYVAGPCASGLSQVALKHGLPVLFGVLTTDTLEQALERAGSKAGNKGAETAQGLLELCDVLETLDGA